MKNSGSILRLWPRRLLVLIPVTFIKHAFYWAFIFIFCNVAQIFILFVNSEKTGFLGTFPGLILGLLLQLPLLVLIIWVVTCLELVLYFLQKKRYKFSTWLLTFLFTIVFLFFYFASLQMYRSVSAFLSLDIFRIISTDLKGIFSMVWHDSHGNVVNLFLLTSFFAGLNFILNFRLLPKYSQALKPFRKYRKNLLVLLFASLVCCFPLIMFVFVDVRIQKAAIYHSFPTSYTIYSIFSPLLSHEKSGNYPGCNRKEKKRLISLQEYAKKNKKLARRPNIFFILLEGVSSEHLGFNGYFRREVTSNLNSLASDSLVFTNAYAPSNHSNYSATSIFGSVYPRRKDTLDLFWNINYPVTTIFDILSFYDYETAVISSNDEDWQGIKRFLKNARIDSFFHFPDFKKKYYLKEKKSQTKSTHYFLADSHTIDETQKKLVERDNSRPIFLYINLQRTHFPYHLPENEATFYKPASVDFEFTYYYYPKKYVEVVRNCYDNALRYVDKQVGRFVQFLKKKKLYEESLIIVSSDHGEAFYKHDFPTHGTSLFDDQVKCFIIFKTPLQKKIGLRRDVVSTIDIIPSVLKIIGLSNHPNFQGRNIIDQVYKNRKIYMTSQGIVPADAVVQYPWKFIRYKMWREPQLINLELDRDEKKDFSKAHPREVKELARALNQYISEHMYYYSQVEITDYPPEF
ncbi:sulfatase-like hydrolase/transferase [Candidatus Riflebacteria bacterium]